MQNAKCKIEVFSSKMNKKHGRSPYHNSAFCIFYFALLWFEAKLQTTIYRSEKRKKVGKTYVFPTFLVFSN